MAKRRREEDICGRAAADGRQLPALSGGVAGSGPGTTRPALFSGLTKNREARFPICRWKGSNMSILRGLRKVLVGHEWVAIRWEVEL